jgi:hypothetical protein
MLLTDTWLLCPGHGCVALVASAGVVLQEGTVGPATGKKCPGQGCVGIEVAHEQGTYKHGRHVHMA